MGRIISNTDSTADEFRVTTFTRLPGLLCIHMRLIARPCEQFHFADAAGNCQFNFNHDRHGCLPRFYFDEFENCCARVPHCSNYSVGTKLTNYRPWKFEKLRGTALADTRTEPLINFTRKALLSFTFSFGNSRRIVLHLIFTYRADCSSSAQIAHGVYIFNLVHFTDTYTY